MIAQVTPNLVAGEHIVSKGFVLQPTKFNIVQIPERYDPYLATATNMRLILFLTEQGLNMSLFKGKPKPVCKQVVEWWYQDLKEVTTGNVGGVGGGIHFAFIPHEPLGPYGGKGKRYDMFAECEGLDDHPQFRAQFRDWIAGQVSAGAFPMDQQRQATIQQHHQQLAHQAELKRQASEASKAAWAARFQKMKGFVGGAKDASGKVRLTAAVAWFAAALVALGVSLTLLALTYDAWDGIPREEGYLKIAKQQLKGEEDEDSREFIKGRIADHKEYIESHWEEFWIYGIPGVITLGASIGLFVMFAKKKKAAKAAQPQGEAMGTAPGGMPPGQALPQQGQVPGQALPQPGQPMQQPGMPPGQGGPGFPQA